MKVQRLENGFEALLLPSSGTGLVEIQFWVAVGSLNELPEERGLAHFVEHMVFKGTKTMVVGEASQRIEAMGGEVNAHTSFDHTVYHAEIMAPSAADGITVLADMILNPTFDPHEFNSEKEVILEEIKRAEDDPGSLVGRRVFEAAFAGSEAARPIIGTVEDVVAHDVSKLKSFHHKWYQSHNIRAIVAGDIDPQVVWRQLKDLFEPLPDARTGSKASPRPVLTRRDQGLQVFLQKVDYQQAQFEVSFPSASLQVAEAPLIDLVGFALGGGDSSRLNQRLRLANPVFGAIAASTYTSCFGGLLSFSGLAVEGKLLEGIEALGAEIANVVSREPIAITELDRARIALKVDKLWRDETISGQARFYAQSLASPFGLSYGKHFEDQVLQANPAKVAATLAEWLQLEQPIISVLVNSDSKLTEEDIRSAYQRGIRQGKSRETLPPVGLGPSAAKRLGASAPSFVRNYFARTESIRELPVAPGLTLYYRQMPRPCLFSVVACTQAGQRFEGPARSGLCHALSLMVAHGPAGVEPSGFSNYLEDLGASLEGFSGKDSYGIKLQCLSEHLEGLLEQMVACLRKPALPGNYWPIERDDILETLRTQDDAAAGMAMRQLQKLIYGAHPYSESVYGRPEFIEHLTVDGLHQAADELVNQGPWVVAAAGHLPFENVEQTLRRGFDAWSPGIARDIPAVVGSISAQTAHLTKEREQAHLVVGYKGMSWGDPERAALDVLSTVLGGSGGRMFIELRDKRGLAYSVAPLLSYGCDPGFFGGYVGCSPDKLKEAELAMEQVFVEVCQRGPDSFELARAKNFLLGDHLAAYQRADAQAMTMALMGAYGYGVDDFLRYEAAVKKVDIAAVTACARRILSQPQQRVIVSPENYK